MQTLQFDEFLRSLKQNINSPHSILLGAGASIESGIKSAGDCIWDWKKRYSSLKIPVQSVSTQVPILNQILFGDLYKIGLMRKTAIPRKIATRSILFTQKKHIGFLTTDANIFNLLFLITSPVLDITLSLCLRKKI